MSIDPALNTSKASTPAFDPSESFALTMDINDPLAHYRDQFHLPTRADGSPLLYFAGNSLGLEPKSTRQFVEAELDAWATKGVEAHFNSDAPWYNYHELVREQTATLVGAKPSEVVVMNSLTVNLHLMMVTFFKPTPERHKILMEYPAFPSDTYAIKTQLAYHGLDPNEALIQLRPRDGEHVMRDEDIEAVFDREGDKIALVLIGGVNYYNGQVFDLAHMTKLAHDHGCVVGLDLAHAVGNVPLVLHDWAVDFAVWCSYKYLNSGPGAVAGCFVHEKHANQTDLPRFGGWWGNDSKSRFRMHLQEDFVPVPAADGWQISNPPILALAPVRASLALFDEVGMAAIRAKSMALTGYLAFLIDQLGSGRFEIITPRDAGSRGCQLSIFAHDRPKALHAALQAQGVVCDFREPHVIRVAPVPLYNSFHEVWQLGELFRQHVVEVS